MYILLFLTEVSQGSIGGNEGDHPVESPPLSPGAHPGGRITLITGGLHADPRAQYFAETKSAFVPIGQESK